MREEDQKQIERISGFSEKFSALSNYLGYKKFANEKPKILFLNSQGWIAQEVINAIKLNDYELQVIDVGNLDPKENKVSTDDYLNFHKILIKGLVVFQPDCIFTTNHAAFDEMGLLIKILDQFGIPCISWFVDSPIFIFEDAEPQKSKYLYVFVWEKLYVKRLKELGFENVFYLPLATSKDFLKERAILKTEIERFTCDVAFVGNTNMEYATALLYKVKFKEKEMELAKSAVDYQIMHPDIEMISILSELDNGSFSKLNERNKILLECYCVLEATANCRDKVVSILSKNFNFKVFGDEKWNDIYPSHYCGELDYYKELHYLYKYAKIIVNTTSFQMNTAVNQRVYDVFLCDGLLVSDYREDYDILFGENMIPTFRSTEEMMEVVKYYLEHEKEREEKIESIKSIIKSKHRYINRIEELFLNMRKYYHE
jgi:spore maturation protein CgeB